MSARGPVAARARLLRQVTRRGLFSPGDRVLVGVGGTVSLSLLAWLVEESPALHLAEVAVASVEQDDEPSDAAEQVADLGRAARELGVSFHAVRPVRRGAQPIDVVAELTTLAAREGFQRVALAHTLEDDALRVLESVLARGHCTAIRGLSSRGPGPVVRPFLSLSRGEAVSLVPLRGEEFVTPGPPPKRPGRAAELSRTVVPRLRALVPGCESALAALGREARAVRNAARQRARSRLDEMPAGVGVVAVPVAPRMGELDARATAREALRRCGVAVKAPMVTRLVRLICAAEGTRGATRDLVLMLSPGVTATHQVARGVVVIRATGR